MALGQTQSKPGTPSSVSTNPTKRTGRSSGVTAPGMTDKMTSKVDSPVGKRGGSEPRQVQSKTGITGRGDSAAGVSPSRLSDGVDRPFPSA